MKQKKIKRYDFTKKPRKINKAQIYWARKLVLPIYFKGRKITYRLNEVKDLKPPYLLFCTHSSMLDYAVVVQAIKPYCAHFVASLSGVRDVGNFLLSRFGCFYKRVFVREMNTVRNMRYCAEHYDDIVCVFPESRYSFDGTSNPLPDSLGKMARLLKLPVVCLRMQGSYLTIPQWNQGKWKKPPVECEMKLVATAEETRTLSTDILQERIAKGLERDDYAYQKERRIRINDPQRAFGLHYILYQCPHCGTEFETDSEGDRLWCVACGKSWRMTEYGELQAEEGETEFTHIPDWTKWERENVGKEVRSGGYRFESEVTVHTLPNYKKFYDQGRGRLVQTAEKTELSCRAYGERKDIVWKAIELEGIHVEFNYPAHKRKRKDNQFGDSIEISTQDDSYWLHPLNGRNQLMKLSFATEEIYAAAKERMKIAAFAKQESAEKRETGKMMKRNIKTK